MELSNRRRKAEDRDVANATVAMARCATINHIEAMIEGVVGYPRTDDNGYQQKVNLMSLSLVAQQHAAKVAI